MENNSGQGKLASVPAEIDNWNWGAFLVSWIWGIGNNTYIAFLTFIPFVGLVMPFILGVKGSSWAWRNKRWESIEHFRSVQRKWVKWSLIAYAVAFTTIAIVLFTTLKSAEPYKLAVAQLHKNQQAIALLGPPVTTGVPMGSMQVSGPTGHAEMSFDVEGQRNSGTVYFKADKDMGRWSFDQIELELDDREERMDLR